jgi:serine/threonine protein kinase
MGPCGDLLYIAMRYVAGADLRAVLKAHEHLSPAQAILLIGQAGRALDSAHRAGLVHRDVKPANLLIERGVDDDPDHVYLADFGITKHEVSRSGLTATGHFVGTLAYVAPEQIQGKPVDARTDVYSLGCVLYESLTGRVPFPKEVDAAVIWAHVEEMPTAPSAVRPELPSALDEVIARALAKKPDDRYPTCRQLMDSARSALEADLPSDTTISLVGQSNTVLTGLEAPAQPLAGVRPEPRQPSIADQTPAGAPPSATPPGGMPAPASPTPPGGTAPPASPPAPGERPARRVPHPALGAVALLIVAGIAVWLIARGGSSGSTHAGTKSTMQMPPKSHKASGTEQSNQIMQALANTNNSTTAHGFVPPSTCQPHGASMVTCSHPDFGADAVTFTTYHSLKDLYDAYVGKAKSLGQNPFRTNFGDCTEAQTYGEVGWNHAHQHPRTYTLEQTMSGRLSDNAAAGRVFCTFANSQQYIVWTQNDGDLLGVVSGGPHANTWDWWYGIHHSIDLPASGSNMQMPGA